MTGAEEKDGVDGGVISKAATDSEKDVDMSISSNPQNPPDVSADVTEAAAPAEAEFEYVTGVKLWLATAAVTLVCFLMMLDMSIIVTVSFPKFNLSFRFINHNRPSLESPPTSIRSAMLAGMGARIFYQSTHPHFYIVNEMLLTEQLAVLFNHRLERSTRTSVPR
jgi:hypothetical protein